MSDHSYFVSTLPAMMPIVVRRLGMMPTIRAKCTAAAPLQFRVMMWCERWGLVLGTLRTPHASSMHTSSGHSYACPAEVGHNFWQWATVAQSGVLAACIARVCGKVWLWQTGRGVSNKCLPILD